MLVPEMPAELLGLPEPVTVRLCVFRGWYAWCVETRSLAMAAQMRCLGSRVLCCRGHMLGLHASLSSSEEAV
jgi:predicted alpha/beta hydrolase